MDLYNAELNGNELRVLHRSGFFSCCSVTLYNLLRVQKPVNVVWPYDTWIGPDGKAFSHYFKPEVDFNELPKGVMPHPAISSIDRYDFGQLSKMVPLYFNSRPRIGQLVTELIHKYQIDFENTVYLKIRGTDKITENPRIHSDEYLKQIAKGKRVLVQTDELQILNYVKEKLGDRAFHFQEIGHEDSEMLPHCFASYYIATTVIASRCSEVVCDAGNHGFWICMYRGSRDGVTQLYSSVRLIK